MRRALLPLLAAALPLLTACSACPRESRSLLARPDFSTPAASLRVLLTAISCDDARSEYLCLGETLKRQYGATYDAWLLGREDLFGEHPLLRSLARHLEADSIEATDPARTLFWFEAGGRTFGLLFERQRFWEIETEDGRRPGGFLDPTALLPLTLEGRRLVLTLTDPQFRAILPANIRSLRIGEEWKLADLITPPQP